MEVEYALIADAAQTSPDGKLYVMGGGIDRIFADQYPALHPTMALVVKIRLHPVECDKPHKLAIELWNEDGQQFGPKIEGEFEAKRQPKARSGSVQMVLNIMGLEFPKEGDYEFHISVNGQYLKSLPLYVERSTGDATTASDVPSS